MQYGYMGASNLRVSKICLGTMHFGGVTPEAESHAIMDKALEMGINFFDTANVYGGPAGTGATESVIGNWFAQGGGRRDQVVLATKTYNAMNRPAIAADPNDDKGVSTYKVRRDLAASLKRLQTDHVDLYQVHHIDRRVRPEEFWGTFGKVLDDGDVLYMGTSNFPGWGLTKFQSFAAPAGPAGPHLRADPVQPAQSLSRVGGHPRGRRFRHRSLPLHAAGRRSADRPEEGG